MKRALLSAFDKTGLAAFAEGLHRLGVELVASGGTARFLADAGLRATPVESLTGFAEMLGHRVVTLHPAVHGGILARRDVPQDLADLEEHGFGVLDLVCVNLYPFEETVARLDVTWDEAIEKIDVGGPAMLRAAAKNHAHVVPVCRVADYETVLAELRADGTVSEATRRSLAARAFATTAAYDAAVARWLTRHDATPEALVLAFDRVQELAYGENPHQRAAYYAERGARRHLLSRVEQRHGKPLSYNNLNDLAAARALADELASAAPAGRTGPAPTEVAAPGRTAPRAACVIVKHANPCGVGVDETVAAAYEKALACDPVSAYGGVVVLTGRVSAALGERLAEQFVEVLFAPGFDEQALEALVRKPGVRVLDDVERRAPDPGELGLRRVQGGLLVQDADQGAASPDGMTVVCGEVGDAVWADALLAWTVVKHVASNAIVLVSGGATIGVGAGQMSRVDAVRIALAKAAEHGHDPCGAVLASDAFFPFADGPQLALDAGVATIVQPGGSKRDDEVVRAVRDADAAMVFTHRRHFKH
jgi:phosphoribosylaminoimidazolecarboxamide formyltransferase/IMP cyclohydrolase